MTMELDSFSLGQQFKYYSVKDTTSVRLILRMLLLVSDHRADMPVLFLEDPNTPQQGIYCVTNVP